MLQRTREWGLFLQQVKCSQSNKSSGPWTERTHTHPAEWVRVQYCIITRDFNCYNTVYLLQRSENLSFTWMLFSHCTCSLKQQRVFQETFCFFLIYFSTDLTSDWFQVLLFSFLFVLILFFSSSAFLKASPSSAGDFIFTSQLGYFQYLIAMCKYLCGINLTLTGFFTFSTFIFDIGIPYILPPQHGNSFK